MSFVHEVDYGTPQTKAEKSVTLTIDGREVTGVPRAPPLSRGPDRLRLVRDRISKRSDASPGDDQR
jgi:hypothetical protein